MKINLNVLCIALLSAVQLVVAQSFVKVTGLATDIAMSPKDGSVYVVGTSKNIFKYSSRYKKFVSHGKQSKNTKSITVHPNGAVYMISTTNDVHIDINGRWNKIPGIKAKDLNIDKLGKIRALDQSGKLKTLFSGQWRDHSIANRNTTGFNQIIGKNSKELFARFKDNKFKLFKSGRWTTLNGNPLKITIDEKTGAVYAVGRNRGIYEWKNNKWLLLKNTRKDFKDVAVYNGKIWAIATDKSIYYYDKNKAVKTEKDYAGTYKITVTRRLARDNNKDDFFGTMGVYFETKFKGQQMKLFPEDNKPNRVVDIPKNNAAKFRQMSRGVHPKDLIYTSERAYNDKDKGTNYYTYYYTIDRVREFKLSEEMASGNAVFDFQFHFTSKTITGDWGGKWSRIKIPLKDLILKKEHYYWVSNVGYGNNGFCFKVEKL